MKKNKILMVFSTAFALVSLASCSMADNKEIKEQISGKSQDEVIEMLNTKNSDEEVVTSYKDGFKLEASVSLKGKANIQSYHETSDKNLNVSADAKVILNSDGVQATASGKYKGSLSDTTNSGKDTDNAKLSVKYESLKDETDAYAYLDYNIKLGDEEKKDTTKAKFKKSNSSDLLPDNNFEYPEISYDDLEPLLKDATMSVGDGLLLFTIDLSEEASKTNSDLDFDSKDLKGNLVIGFDKEYRLSRVHANASATSITLDTDFLQATVSDFSFKLKLDLKGGSYSFKSISDKDKYQYQSMF